MEQIIYLVFASPYPCSQLYLRFDGSWLVVMLRRMTFLKIFVQMSQKSENQYSNCVSVSIARRPLRMSVRSLLRECNVHIAPMKNERLECVWSLLHNCRVC